MLITKFNRLIRNRVIWGIFAFVVVISFVGLFTPRGGCSSEMNDKTSIATIQGEPVTPQEEQAAKFNTYIGLCMMFGRQLPNTPELNKEIEAQTWRRLAAVRVARKLNLTPSDQEVLDAIQRDPQFCDHGIFVRARYNAFVQGVLANLGATAQQFEQQMRENLMLQKLQIMIGSAAWIAPEELRHALSMYTDSFKAEYVLLTTNDLRRAVTVTADDARAFYDSHTNLFIAPPEVAVRYVAFPVSNLMDKVTLTAQSVQAYYDEHMDDFATTDTNDNQEMKPLAEVAGTITNLLRKEGAEQAARDQAADFVVALAPDRSGEQVTFEAEAAKRGLPVYTSGLFTADGEIPGIQADLRLNRVAFELRNTPEDYFSDAVDGKADIYVLALESNVDARLPEFDEVRAEATRLAQAQAEEDALRKQAEVLHATLLSGLSTTGGFARVASDAGLTVVTTKLFSAYDAPDQLGGQETLVDLTSRMAGEMTDVIDSTNGLVIAYVTERKPSEPEALVTARDQVSANLTRRRGRILFGEWEHYLIRDAKYPGSEIEKEAEGEEHPAPTQESPLVD